MRLLGNGRLQVSAGVVLLAVALVTAPAASARHRSVGRRHVSQIRAALDFSVPTLVGTIVPGPAVAGPVTPVAGGPAYYGAPVSLAMTATDASSGIAGIGCTFQMGTFSTHTNLFAPTPGLPSFDTSLPLSDGENPYSCVSVNVAGVVSQALAGDLVVDSVAPQSGPPPGTFVPSDASRPVTFTITATDPMVGYTFHAPGVGVATLTTSVDGAAPTTTTGAQTITVSTPGEHTVSSSAADLLGNTEPMHSRTILIDQTPPTVTVDGRSSLRVKAKGTSTLVGTGADDHGVVAVTVDLKPLRGSGGERTVNATCGCRPNATSVDWAVNLTALTSEISGTYTSSVTATDVAGNTTTVTGPRIAF